MQELDISHRFVQHWRRICLHIFQFATKQNDNNESLFNFPYFVSFGFYLLAWGLIASLDIQEKFKKFHLSEGWNQLLQRQDSLPKLLSPPLLFETEPLLIPQREKKENFINLVHANAA